MRIFTKKRVKGNFLPSELRKQKSLHAEGQPPHATQGDYATPALALPYPLTDLPLGFIL